MINNAFALKVWHSASLNYNDENEMHFQGCYQELVGLGSHQDSTLFQNGKQR